MSGHAYVARFGWTSRDLLLVPASLLFVAVGMTGAVNGEWVMGSLAALMGGAYLFLWTAVGLSRRVALAVTADGITLGAAPLWPASRTAHVPWSDVEAVVLWRQKTAYTTMRYVGVQRRVGAPPLPGSMRSPALRRIGKALVPADLSTALVADSRQVSFWRLDKRRLVAAVNQFAPHVQVVDES